MNERPNLLLLFTDQQRFDTIAALGNPIVRTPALDWLCHEGVAFTSAYTPSSVCVPARCSLHYGQYPMRTGCYDNGSKMPEDRPSFMQMLTEAGYRTHGIGKCHFTPDKSARRGFETREVQEELPRRGEDDYMKFLDAQGWGECSEPHGVRGEMYYVPQVSPLPQRWHPTQWVGDRAVAFIESEGRRAKPWLLFCSFIHPHPPFAPPAPWHKLYRAYDMPLPHVPQDLRGLLTYVNRYQNRYKYRDQGVDHHLLRCLRAYYYACISFVDFQVGRILEALARTGQMERTLILFASDHGEHLGDYYCFGKRSMHDTCLRIPLLLRWPGHFEDGVRCDVPVSLVDVMPTLLHAAGCPTEGLKTDGEDLRTILAGTHDRPAVHAQYAQAGMGIYVSVTRRWKYAYSAPDNQEYLFDRLVDPRETRNRAGAPSTRKVLRDLRDQTIQWLASGGETAAVDGNRWRVYPRLEVPEAPDAGLLVQDPPDFALSLPGYTDDQAGEDAPVR